MNEPALIIPQALGFLQQMGPIEALVIGLPLLFIIILPFWQIFSKAGFSGALSILRIFPVINLALLYFLAFSNWPLEKMADHSQDQKNPPPIPRK